MIESFKFGTGTKAYVSGPMTLKQGQNKLGFEIATRTLRDEGMLVINPCEGGIVDQEVIDYWTQLYGGDDFRLTLPYRFLMRRGVQAVLAVDVVYALPGWDGSNGAILELTIAQQIGTPTIAFDMDPTKRVPLPAFPLFPL